MGLDLHIFSIERHPDKAIDSKLTVKNFINMEQYLAFKNFEMCNRFNFPEEQPLKKHIFDIIDRSKKADERFYIDENSSQYRKLKKKITDKNQIYRFINFIITI